MIQAVRFSAFRHAGYSIRRYLLSWVMGVSGLCFATAAAAEETIKTLPETVVSASSIPLPAEQVGSAVTVITAEELEQKQVRFVSDVLREVPGVAVNRTGPAGSFTQVRIRGAEANQTLVLIDGVEVNDPSGGSEFDFGALLAADIERIEVLRGPQSALYGSDAIGGVINIVTKRGKGPATGALGIEGSSFRTGQVSANLRGGGDRYDFSFGATGFSTGGVSVARESEGNAEADGHRNQTYNARLGFSPAENLEFDFSGRYVKSTIETDPQPAVAAIVSTVDGDVRTETVQRVGSATAKLMLLDGDWEQILRAGSSEDEARTFTNGAITFHSEGAKTRLNYQSNYFFESSFPVDASHTVTFLAEREDESQVTRSAFGSSDLEIANYGYVGEYLVNIQERLFLSGSVRRDDNDIFKDATTYRSTAAYLYAPTDTRLHGSYGTGVKNPTLFELFGFGPNFVPNPNLRPEKSRGWDIGVEQRFLNGRASADITYFNNRIADLIRGAGNTAVNLSGTSKIQGIEAFATARLAEGLILKAQYTFTGGQDATGTTLVRRAKHLASIDLTYAFLENRAKLNLAIDYNGDQRDIQFSNFFATRNIVTLDGFTLVSVAASYELGKGVELFGRVENLLDENYQEVLGFSSPGIGGFIGIRAKFGLF